MKSPRYFGRTSNGWVISESITMTNRAKYALKIERGSQISLIENRKGDWYYMFSYDTSMLAPTEKRDSYLVSIKGSDVKKALGLQDALESLGLERDEAKEAIGIIVSVFDGDAAT